SAVNAVPLPVTASVLLVRVKVPAYMNISSIHILKDKNWHIDILIKCHIKSVVIVITNNLIIRLPDAST
ncbi:hypothetical protein ACQWG0_25135, partial [Salmonella enterica subsp. enterica serovar Infantis]